MKLLTAFISWAYDLITGFFSSLQDKILERAVRGAILQIVAGIAVVAGATILGMGALRFIDWLWPVLWERFQIPIIVIFLIIAAGIYLNSRGEKEPEAIVEPCELERQYADQNWPIAAHVVEQGLNECGPSLGLRKVDGIDGLESPKRVITRGGVLLYQLCAPKNDAEAEVDEEVSAIVLQKAIDRGLHNCDFDGVATPLIPVDGINYPAYMVDKVRDGMGYVTILVAQPSEKYIKQRKTQQAAKMAQKTGRHPEDKDI